MKRIIDNRKKEKFMMDDEYLNGMARLCGWQATIVYVSLCRHANKNQECFPSIKLISEENSVSRPTIIKGIDILEKRNIIKVEKTRSKGGKWLNNTYVLLDKSQWNYNQVNDVYTANQVNENTPPSKRHLPIQVNDVDTKETHLKETHLNETHLSELERSQGKEFNKQIAEILNEFKTINSAINFGNKTQRLACQDLITEHGFEQTMRITKFAISVQGQPYMPVITTPYQLHQKFAQLKIATEQHIKKNKPALII